MNADRMLEYLLAETRASATTHAVRRLLERRPDLKPPGNLPVLVPRDEDAAYVLDRLAFMAWISRHVEQAAEVEISTALRSGATWAQLAEVLRCTAAEALERYGHLAPLASDAELAPGTAGEPRAT